MTATSSPALTLVKTAAPPTYDSRRRRHRLQLPGHQHRQRDPHRAVHGHRRQGDGRPARRRRSLAPRDVDHLHRHLHHHPGRPRRRLGHQHRHGVGHFDGTTVTSDDRHASRSPRSRRPALTIDKTVDAVDLRPRSATSSPTATWSPTRGNVTLTAPFTVSRRQGDRSTCPATASLAPGASITCTRHLHRHPGRPRAGSVTNTAVGHATGTTTSPTDTRRSTRGPEPGR